MKRILALTIAPLLVSVAFAGTAAAGGSKIKTNSGTSAQIDTEMDAGAGTDTGADVGVDTGVTASTGTEANFGSVISAIQASGTAAADVQAVTDASNIEIIRVGDLAQGESMNALDNALSQNQEDVEALRDAVEANSTVAAKLEEEQVQVENVVAAETSADGNLVVYVR
ncbi:hypothetical protein [Nitratireductor luteus]|uniref:hypothetical protein n=1 Tax=Nitratireductor luteus TaxID=2976980 RepID=UPI00223FCBCB|nr:hypothetical protein [Nitratireductor luteus]